MSRRAAIYLRVSTFDQVDGTSLDVQEQRCHAAATSKGWEVIERFIDGGVSGTKADRPEWRRMLRACEAGEVDAVVVMKLDRFGRNAGHAISEIDRLTDLGVAFLSVAENIDLSTAHGKMLRTVLAGFAEFERDSITERGCPGSARRPGPRPVGSGPVARRPSAGCFRTRAPALSALPGRARAGGHPVCDARAGGRRPVARGGPGTAERRRAAAEAGQPLDAGIAEAGAEAGEPVRSGGLGTGARPQGRQPRPARGGRPAQVRRVDRVLPAGPAADAGALGRPAAGAAAAGHRSCPGHSEYLLTGRLVGLSGSTTTAWRGPTGAAAGATSATALAGPGRTCRAAAAPASRSTGSRRSSGAR